MSALLFHGRDKKMKNIRKQSVMAATVAASGDCIIEGENSIARYVWDPGLYETEEAFQPVNRNVLSRHDDIGFTGGDLLLKHCLSAIIRRECDILPTPDATGGFSYLSLEKLLGISTPGTSVTLLEWLHSKGMAERRVAFETLACPACDATAPIVRNSAPGKIASGSSAIKPDHSLNEKQSDNQPVYQCRVCNSLFGPQNAGVRPAFTYSVPEEIATHAKDLLPDYSKYKEVFLKHGLKQNRLASVKGLSGVTHKFDFLVEGAESEKSDRPDEVPAPDAKRLLVNILISGQAHSDAGTLKSMYAEISDIPDARCLLISIPGLRTEAGILSRHYGIEVLEAGTEEEALSSLSRYLDSFVLNERAVKSSAFFGITGLEKIVEEIPRGRICIISGPAGSLKTTISMEFLLRGAEHQERGLLVSTGENMEHLRENVRRFGHDASRWGNDVKILDISSETEIIREMLRTGMTSELKLKIVDLLDEIKNVASKHRAKRVVIDTITDFWSGTSFSRDFVNRFIQMLSSMKVSVLLTKTIPYESDEFSYESGYVDGIIRVGFQAIGDTRKRYIEVPKMRGVKVNSSRFELTIRTISEDGKCELAVLETIKIIESEKLV